MDPIFTWIAQHHDLAVTIFWTSNAILTAFVILLENREPEKSIAWFLVLLTFPFVGFVVYLFFGRDWHKHSYRQKRLNHAITEQRLKSSRHSETGHVCEEGDVECPIRMLAANTTGMETTHGNRVNILTNAHEKYPRMLAALKTAKRSIDMEYYIFRYDTTGREIVEILKERARNGVRVRFIIDGTGSLGFGAKAFADMRAAGVHVTYFSPLITLLYFFKANYRDHRKIAVVDDEVVFTGGINIGDAYLGITSRGNWRDTSVELRGPCVEQFVKLFEENWTRSTGEKPRTDVKGLPPFTDGETVNVIPSGPDTDWKAIHQTYLALIHNAKHRLRVQTPYFVPDESLVSALTLAALRGVRVELMFPHKPDWPYLRWVAHTYAEELLRAGGHVYEYKSGFLHTKAVIMDDSLASVGTCNMDIRSLRLDFEVNVLLSSEKSLQHLNEDFERDLRTCDEMTYDTFVERPVTQRFKESLARLVSPLL
jgi:cardiolipin synthase A/B